MDVFFWSVAQKYPEKENLSSPIRSQTYDFQFT